MRLLSKDEFLLRLRRAKEEKTDRSLFENKLTFRTISIENENLSELDLSGLDFSWSDFRNIRFVNCNFNDTVLDHAKFRETDFSGSSFVNARLFSTDLRGCNLSHTNCDGTDFTASVLIDAELEQLYHTDRTVHFRNHCPEQGYFFGYKKCFNDRMVTLLIPKDAKRCSSTTNACRCDKAKVVAITDLTKSISYDKAFSYADEGFVYPLGETVYADSYNEDRWLDSSHGIHFWMTWEEAAGYL